MATRKIIIDTDCGGDDAVGIMAVLTAPTTTIAAITAVWGNVDVDQGMENLGKILDVFDVDIPFYKGASTPLVGERETTVWGGYGRDGFGDAGLPGSARVADQPTTHAAIAITEILRGFAAERAVASAAGGGGGDGTIYQIIALGPLTNLALAIRLDPGAFEILGSETEPSIVFMGGTSEGKGNSSMTAEFNVHCDPEAAHVVFNHRGMPPIAVVPWEATVDCSMTWKFFDEWVGRHLPAGVARNKYQVFIEKIYQRLEVFTRPLDDGTKADTGDDEATQDVTCVIPDAVAVLVACYPDAITDSFTSYSTVERFGRETRGQMCIDWYGTEASMAKKGRWRNCKVVTRANVDMFLNVMKGIVARDE